MFYFSKPKGGLMVGKRLLKMPAVCRMKSDAPARILFVSDLHIRKNTWKTAENVYALLESTKPELVLFGGDFAENDQSFEQFFEGLKKYSFPLGMYAVEGNNEYGRMGKDREKVLEVMKNGGVTLLRGERVTIDTGRGRIELAGVRNAFLDPDANASDVFSNEEGVYRILLAHEPLQKYLEESEGKADLFLGGHTHGGQINVLGFTCYELINYESNSSFYSTFIYFDRFHLFLCNE